LTGSIEQQAQAVTLSLSKGVPLYSKHISIGSTGHITVPCTIQWSRKNL